MPDDTLRTELRVSFETTGRVLVDHPRDAQTASPTALVVVHGYGRPLDELVAFARSVAPEAIVLAPVGPSAFYQRRHEGGERVRGVGHGWIAAEDRRPEDRRNDAFLASAWAEARARFGLTPERTVVVGFSQGVGVATHFLLTHPEAATGLIGLAGGLAAPYRGDLGRLARHDVLWVTGGSDDAYPPAYTAELLDAWRRAGARPEAVELEAGHFLFEDARAPVAAWLRAHGARSGG